MADKKQNVIAITDDLWNRLLSLQALYQVEDKPIPMDELIDRALDALVEKRAIDQ